jgi:hypothetical protein
MTEEVMRLIIMLCAINGNASQKDVELYQLKCYDWYRDCVYEYLEADLLGAQVKFVEKCRKKRPFATTKEKK